MKTKELTLEKIAHRITLRPKSVKNIEFTARVIFIKNEDENNFLYRASDTIMSALKLDIGDTIKLYGKFPELEESNQKYKFYAFGSIADNLEENLQENKSYFLKLKCLFGTSMDTEFSKNYETFTCYYSWEGFKILSIIENE
jgi:hypothetical protein